MLEGFVVFTCLHSYNYVLRNYFFVMFFVYMMFLLLVKTLGSPFVNMDCIIVRIVLKIYLVPVVRLYVEMF